MPTNSPWSLTIVIPALNEEEAIGGTIERCLKAREEIQTKAGLQSVEIIVVSDGSTDRTPEIASSFDEVRVIVFEKNQGYGAAIKAGFQVGRGNLVGFLDADGTCDPSYFAAMCQAAIEDEADVVLGTRLGPDSQMPRIRRLGNRLFAASLGLLCRKYITDTASGMRVIRRGALETLYPLPDGLHFTPAMSARALLGGQRVVEVPMSYEERVGQSKLSVVKDGIRFTQAILGSALCYRPERLFLIYTTLCAVVTILLGLYPLEFYLREGRVEEWMIYRFLLGSLCASTGFMALSAAALANRMSRLGPNRKDGDSFWSGIIGQIFQGRTLVGVTGTLLVSAVFLVWPGLLQFVSSGHISLHWSRVLVASVLALLAFQVVVTGILQQVLRIWETQQGGKEVATSLKVHFPLEASRMAPAVRVGSAR